MDSLKETFLRQGNLLFIGKAIKEVRFGGTRPLLALYPISPCFFESSTCCLTFWTCPPSLHTNGHRAEVWLGKAQCDKVGSVWRAISTYVGRPDNSTEGSGVPLSCCIRPHFLIPPRHPLPGGCLPEITSITAFLSYLEGPDSAPQGRVLPSDPLGCCSCQ